LHKLDNVKVGNINFLMLAMKVFLGDQHSL
jgi:hypothetical protein